MDDDIAVIEFPSYFKEDLPDCEWLFNPSPGQLELSSNVLLHDFEKIPKKHRSKSIYKNIELQNEINSNRSNRKTQLESALRTKRLSEISTSKGTRYDNNNPLKKALTIPKHLTTTSNRITQPSFPSQLNLNQQRPKSALGTKHTALGQHLKDTLENVVKVSVKSPDEIRVQKQLDKVRAIWDEEANMLSDTMNPTKINGTNKRPERPSSAPSRTSGYLRRTHAHFEKLHLQNTIAKADKPMLQRQHSGASTVVSSILITSPVTGRTSTGTYTNNNNYRTTANVTTTKTINFSGINSNPSNPRKPPHMVAVDDKNRHPPRLYHHAAVQDIVQSSMLISMFICSFAQSLRNKVYLNQLIIKFLNHGQGPAYNLSIVKYTQSRIRYKQRLRQAINLRYHRMRIFGFLRFMLIKLRIKRKRLNANLLIQFLKFLKAKNFLRASLSRLCGAVRLIQKCSTSFRVCNTARCHALGIFWSRIKRAYGGSIYPETKVVVPMKDGLSVKDRQLVMKEVLRNVRKVNCARRNRLTALLNNSQHAFEKVNAYHARRFLHTDRTWNHQAISASSTPSSPIDNSNSPRSPFPVTSTILDSNSNNKDPTSSYSSASSTFIRGVNKVIIVSMLSSKTNDKQIQQQQQLDNDSINTNVDSINNTPSSSSTIKGCNGVAPSGHKVFSNHKGRRIFNPDESVLRDMKVPVTPSLKYNETLPDPVLVPQIYLANNSEYSSRFNVFLLYTNIDIVGHIVDALQAWKQGNNFQQDTTGNATNLNTSFKKTANKKILKKNGKKTSLTFLNPSMSIMSNDTTDILKDMAAGSGGAVVATPSAPTHYLPRSEIERAKERKIFEAIDLRKTVREYFYASPQTPRIYRRRGSCTSDYS